MDVVYDSRRVFGHLVFRHAGIDAVRRLFEVLIISVEFVAVAILGVVFAIWIMRRF